MTQLAVRDVELGDAEAIVGILNRIVEARVYTAFTEVFSVEAERDYIRKFPARGVWKVATSGPKTQVLGFQILEPFGSYTKAFDHVATIGTYVDLGHRRQGIATALFDASFAAARRLGYGKIFTFVRADNTGALATYRSRGFEVVGTARRHALIDGRYIDEVLIERSLDDSMPEIPG